MSESKPKKLSELTVVHLRNELEKRNINKNGVKADLYERLEKALREEGHDPESFVFETIQKGSSKRSRRGDGDESVEVSEDDKDENNTYEEKETDNDTAEVHTEDNQTSIKEKEEKNTINTNIKNESISSQNKEDHVKTSSGEKENVPTQSTLKDDKSSKIKTDTPTKKTSTGKKETESSPKSNIKEDTLPASPGLRKSNRLSSEKNKCGEINVEPLKSESKPSPEKKMQIKSDEEKSKQVENSMESHKEEKCTSEANGIDHEDSLNLTIGEDEDNFLGEEEEISQDKDQKDEIHRGGEQNKNAQGEKKQEKSSNEDKDVKSGEAAEEATQQEKAKKPTSGINSIRNLWISGLSSITRASDLKQIFSKFGKVVGAKVVTNARTPGARCYGFVTMTCSEDASKAMGSLHLTELHGRIISVVKATNDSAGPPKRNTEAKRNERPSPKKVEEKKKEQATIRNKQNEKEDKIVPPGTEDFEKMEPAAPGTENEIPVEGESKDKEIHSSRSSVRSENHPDGKRARSKTSSHRSFDKHRLTSPNVLTFSKIKEERDKQRMREKERMIREEDRRRDNQRQRDAERKQREESMSIRLDRERQKLKMEREKIERERIELLKLKQERQRLERERARLEREKLEREKEELERLKRQTLSQLEEERRKRSLSSSRDREYESSRKRTATEVRYESSHSRYPDRDYKKENSHKSGDISNSRRAYETDTRARAWEEAAVTVREEWPKERDSARYIDRSGSNYRPQEESRSKSERHGRDRYQDSSKGDRYSERPVDSWHGSSVGMKSFSGGGSGRDTWVSGAPDRTKVDSHSSQSWPRPPGNSNRWSGGPMNNRGPQAGPMFPQNMESGIPGMGMMSMGQYSSSGTNRFDSYKLPY